MLAELLEGLVDGEAGADRRDREQHAARLAEVDRAEVEAVDHRRGRGTRLGDAFLPGLVVVHRRSPGDVMHRARAADTALVGAVVAIERAALLAADLPGGLAVRRELERLLEEVAALLRVEGVGANGVESLQRDLARHLRVVGDQRLVARLDEQELVAEALGIPEPKGAISVLG